MWEFFLCLLPSLMLILVKILLQWNWIRRLADSTVHQSGRCMWAMACRLLKLPHVSVPEFVGECQAEVRLICKPTALASHLKKHCYALAQPPLARWPQADPHLQIITDLMWPTKEGAELQGGVRFKRDNLLLVDGGIVALDWAVSLTAQVPAKRNHHHHHPGGRVLGLHSSNPAIVIVIPNALGRVTPHLIRLCHQALQQGFYPVVFHRRGQGGCPLTTPHYQEFGNPSDFAQAVAYLRSHHPSSTLLAISEGSGSGLLLSYLGECGSSSYLTAAACISPVFHGQLWFEYELPWLYQWIALIYRKLQINRYATALSSVMDVAKILHCTSLRDMEELMFCATKQSDRRTSVDHHVDQDTSRLSTKPDWASYWERNEPLRDADEVAVPVLCLCSRDDPLLPPLSTVPEALFHNSPYFLLAITEQGGHCGFIQEDGHGGTTSWSHFVVLEYFRVVADFFGVEDKKGLKDDIAHHGSQSLRHSASTVPSRRRRSTLLRKERPILGSRRRQTSTPSDTFTLEEEEQVDFTWNRSYTR